jgi:DNA-binding transcriptional LysR family regulator
MDPEELRAFLSVVEAGSFLVAAEKLAVSRTTLRRRIGFLEARVGVPLLEATQQGVVLTEAGRRLAVSARGLLAETQAILASVREAGRLPAGVVRFSCPVGLPPHMFVKILVALRGAFPEVRGEARYSDNPLGESLVDVDFAVHFDEPEPSGKWISMPLAPAHERLIATTDYLERCGTPTTIADLARHELLGWRAPGADGRSWPTRDGGYFRVEPRFVSADVHAVRQVCIEGLGIALVPDALLPDPGVPDGFVVGVLPDLVGRDRFLRVTYPSALAETPNIKMIRTWIAAFLGNV